MTAERKPIPDLAKGIAVLAMIQVHLMEVFARPELFHSITGKISLFMGGPFAAPVFLAIMGYFLASSQRTTSYLLKRGAGLVILGLLLNTGFNLHLLIKIFAGKIDANPWHYILGADILVNAGLTILIFSLLSLAFKRNAVAYLMLALFIGLLPLVFPDPLLENYQIKYFASFFIGVSDWSYFPLVPWMAYSLAGYSWRLMEDRKMVRKVIRSPERYYLAGSIWLILLLSSRFAWDQITVLDSYYHHDLRLYLWIIGFLVGWFILLDWSYHLWSHGRFNAYLRWTGKNVTAVYIVQWLIIGNLGTAIYRSQFLVPLLLWFAAITVVTSLAVFWGKKIMQ